MNETVRVGFIDRLLVAIVVAFAFGATAGYTFAHSSAGMMLRPWRGLAREIAHSIIDAGGQVK